VPGIERELGTVLEGGKKVCMRREEVWCGVVWCGREIPRSADSAQNDGSSCCCSGMKQSMGNGATVGQRVGREVGTLARIKRVPMTKNEERGKHNCEERGMGLRVSV
jgi:hypothetical protein